MEKQLLGEGIIIFQDIYYGFFGSDEYLFEMCDYKFKGRMSFIGSQLLSIGL